MFEEGKVRIIDRKKNLFKLAISEFVSPTKLEHVYEQSQFNEMYERLNKEADTEEFDEKSSISTEGGIRGEILSIIANVLKTVPSELKLDASFQDQGGSSLEATVFHMRTQNLLSNHHV